MHQSNFLSIGFFDRLINVGLHVATLGTRFLFIFFLAKYLDPSSVGYYGIFTASVSYALYFVGLDFYTYVSREIAKTPADQRGKLLKSQAILSAFLYLAIFPLSFWILKQVGWPNYLVFWFFPILLLEHFNQEVSRLLIALSAQLTASLILFIRQGSWALVIVLLMIWNDNARTLAVVMTLWFVAGAAAACMGFWKLKQFKTKGWALAIDWKWVKKGIVVSTTFLFATLALRGVQTFDRYWLEALGGIELVAAYVLLLGVASTLLTFLDAAVFSFTYPALIQHNHKCEHQQARKKVNQLFLQTIICSLFFGLVSWLLLPHFLAWIGNPVYQQAIYLYPWLLSAMVINALGLVPHYALYARGKDRPIIYSHLASLAVFIFVTWIFSLKYSVLAVLFGLNVAFAVILLWKFYAYWVLIHKEVSVNAIL